MKETWTTRAKPSFHFLMFKVVKVVKGSETNRNTKI